MIHDFSGVMGRSEPCKVCFTEPCTAVVLMAFFMCCQILCTASDLFKGHLGSVQLYFVNVCPLCL